MRRFGRGSENWQRIRFGYRRVTARLMRKECRPTTCGVSAVSRGVGDEDAAETADPLDGRGEQSSGERRNERWSMDFVSDCVGTGTVTRMLTVVDDCARESPAIEVDTSLDGLRVRRVLDRVAR
jgi:putative transposase